MDQPLPLPSSLADSLKDRIWTQIKIGQSRSKVYRLVAANRQDLILKTLETDRLHTLVGESERLKWLYSRAPVPRVVDFVQSPTHDFLLQEALPGQDAASTSLPPAVIVDLLADSLRELHSVPIHDCPFVQDIDGSLRESKALLDAGCVDVSNFESFHQGREPHGLYEEMLATRPQMESRIYTHGDYCLPNVIVADSRLSGFVDVGRSGVGDPYRDLALVIRTLDRNLGGDWSARFLSRYGVTDPDLDRIRFFRLLDEFF